MKTWLPNVNYLQQKLQNPKKDHMQLQASGPKSHNMKKTKFYNHLWIKKLLDRH